jgi:hypothetical protein
MTIEQSGGNPHAVVMTYAARLHEPSHERVVHAELARRLAVLLGMGFAGQYDASANFGRRIYLVPSATLVGTGMAHMLGISDQNDLFGGVVPMPYVATKAITHPLLRPEAHAPKGWSGDFAHRVRSAVLPGFSAFSLQDAKEAGRQLLDKGPVRIKLASANAGRDQWVANNVASLDAVLDALDHDDLTVGGVVLEQNLEDVTTFSVGQVHVGDLVATYTGTQRLTRDNNGEIVYGGSDLIVARGGFGALMALDLSPGVRHAVAQAQVYDAAANACYPGFFASRRNYDTVEGKDAQGKLCSGVLEQSWRIGGASPAEVAALEAFRAAPGLRAVRTSSVEVFGEDRVPPPDAQVLYRANDADVGFITKYVETRAYGNTE